jgi:hypothetical protein
MKQNYYLQNAFGDVNQIIVNSTWDENNATHQLNLNILQKAAKV